MVIWVQQFIDVVLITELAWFAGIGHLLSFEQFLLFK